MKIGTFTALAVCFSSNVFAASYQYTITSPDLRQLGQAKNCLDYLSCAPTSTSLNVDARRFHVFVDLPNDGAAIEVLKRCDFKKHGAIVSLTNVAAKTSATSNEITATSDLLSGLKNLYLTPLTLIQKMQLSSTISKLVRGGKKIEAVQHIISTFGLNTYGYKISVDEKLDWVAVTTHENRTIRIGRGFFTDSCFLVQAVRHELEHVAQIARVKRCAFTRAAVNLEDHVQRERSAYLNDISNVGHYCADRSSTNGIIENSWTQMTESYLQR